MATHSTKLFDAFKSAGKTGLTADQVTDIVPNVGYVNHLEKAFGCKFDRIKEGKKVTKFILLNGSAVSVGDSRKAKVAKAPVAKKVKAAATKIVTKKVRVKNTKPVADSGSVAAYDADLDISEVGDRELADIRAQLGL